MYDIITEINDLDDLKNQVANQEMRILKALTAMLDKKGYPGAIVNGYKSIDDDTISIRFWMDDEMLNNGYSTYDVDEFIKNLDI